jgi:hypothetical protein
VTIGSHAFGDIVVVQLADAAGEVAIQAESLGQADVTGDRLAKDHLVGVDPRAVGVQAGQHRIAAGAAQRKLAVGAFEADAPRRQAVDVRTVNQRMPVTTERAVQIVRNDEQNIGTSISPARLLRHGRGRGCPDGTEDQPAERKQEEVKKGFPRLAAARELAEAGRVALHGGAPGLR